MEPNGTAEGFSERITEEHRRKDLDFGHPAEEKPLESAAPGDSQVDDQARDLTIGIDGSFDFPLRWVEGALGEDAGSDAEELQPDEKGLPVNTIEAVLSEKLREGEIRRPFEGLSAFTEGEDVVDRERNQFLPLVIVSDDLEGRPIRVEIDGIGFKDTFATLAIVEGLVAHVELTLKEGGIGQLIDEGTVPGVVLGGDGCTAKDRREGFQLGLEGIGKGGADFLEKGAAVVSKRGAERGETNAGDRLLRENEGGQLSRGQRRRSESGVPDVLVEHLATALF